MSLKTMIKMAAVTLGLTLTSGILSQDVSAQDNWVARTVEEVQADLKSDDNGISRYTIKWGDTLSVLSLATNISIEQLATVNRIENIRLIEVGTIMYFTHDKSIITIVNETGKQVASYSMSSAKEVSTPEVVLEKVQDIPVNDEDNVVQVQATATETPQSVTSQASYSLDYFMFAGIINWNGYKFTYYSQSVLPGGGLSIPGRHVNAQGYVCDGDGYIVLANSAPLGTVIDTPFGAPGKVYDRGTVGNHFDVYVR